MKNLSAILKGTIVLGVLFCTNVFSQSTVRGIGVQSDGKAILVGQITSYDNTSVNHILRLNKNGSIDNSFDVGTGANNFINCVLLNNDKILLGGAFTTFNERPAKHIVQLNSDGSIDENFTVDIDGNVAQIVPLSDGKYLICGSFAECNGESYRGLARINDDGSLDNGFAIGTGVDKQNNVFGNAGLNYVYDAVELPNGKILIGGGFEEFNGFQQKGLVMLNSNGSVDENFTIELSTGSETVKFNPHHGVFDMEMTEDGKILVGGKWNKVNGESAPNLIRLDANGTWDENFSEQQIVSGDIWSIAEQDDGKILIAGSVYLVSAIETGKLARLNAQGSLDRSFDVGEGANLNILSLALREDQILVGGMFTKFQEKSVEGFIVLDKTRSTTETKAIHRAADLLPLTHSIPLTYSKGNLTIHNIEQVTHISLLTLTGKTIQTWKSNSATMRLDISSHCAGEYLVKMRRNDGQVISGVFTKR